MTEKRLYELVPYDYRFCNFLRLHEKTTDHTIGVLGLDHRSVGEAIVDELNDLSEKLYNEQMRTQPIILDTHISDEDWERFKKMFEDIKRGDIND